MMVKNSENGKEYLRIITHYVVIPEYERPYLAGLYAWKCARIPTEEEEVQQVLF